MSIFNIGKGTIDADIVQTYLNGQTTDLSVFNVSEQEYCSKVVNNNIKDNELYVISSDSFNMFGQGFTNVKEPQDPKDLVTVEYMNKKLDQLSSELIKKIDNLQPQTEESIIDIVKKFFKDLWAKT